MGWKHPLRRRDLILGDNGLLPEGGVFDRKIGFTVGSVAKCSVSFDDVIVFDNIVVDFDVMAYYLSRC